MISQDRLRVGFAAFLVLMGGVILVQNVSSTDVAPAPLSEIQEQTQMFSFFGKASTDSSDQETLSAHEFMERDTSGATIVDVRTPGEVAEGYVAGAEIINYNSPDFRKSIDELDRDGTYYLYCRSGNRSGQALQVMKSMGFEKVYNIGGFRDLVRAGVEVAQ